MSFINDFFTLFGFNNDDTDDEQYTDEEELINQLKNTEGNKLLPALNIVINSLEKDFVKYDWREPCMCNCGLVVQAILNTDKETVKELFSYIGDSDGITWKKCVQEHCTVTGMPTHIVFKLLYEKGFKPEDIVHLEYLSNKAILEVAKIDIKEDYFQNAHNLLLYLKAWVKILKKDEELSFSSKKNELEKELLIAVYEENYIQAAYLRDQLSCLI